MIEFVCPHCRKTLQVPEQYLGQSGKCNRCGMAIIILVAPPPLTGNAFDTPIPERELHDHSIQEMTEEDFKKAVTESEAAVNPARGQNNAMNAALKLQQVGVAMTSCGCFILFGIPSMIIGCVILWAVFFGDGGSDTAANSRVYIQSEIEGQIDRESLWSTDVDHDHYITWNEAVAAVPAINLERFRVLDSNGDGMISTIARYPDGSYAASDEEIRRVKADAQRIMPGASDEDVRDMLENMMRNIDQAR